MIERKVYLILGILQFTILICVTAVVGGYEWMYGKHAGIGHFIFGGFLGGGHLLATLLQVDRVLRGKAHMAKMVARSKIRYWRLRMVIFGIIVAILQGEIVPLGIEKHASPTLITAAAINVALITSGTLLGFSELRGL